MSDDRFQVWYTKIGVVGDMDLPGGSDLPMRMAIKKAFFELTGRECDFCFSGWNTPLTEAEQKIAKQAAADYAEWKKKFG
jgi:hypothetical protein